MPYTLSKDNAGSPVLAAADKSDAIYDWKNQKITVLVATGDKQIRNQLLSINGAIFF